MTSQEPQTPFSANVDEMHETEVIVVSTPAPVFVDSTGRRRRVLRRLAYGFGALCMLYGGLVSVSLAGGPVSSTAVLPLPDLHGDPDDPVAEERPTPSRAPAVTPVPRSTVVADTLPRRPVSQNSTLRPDARRPSATSIRTPTAAPTRRTPTPGATTATKPVESATTPSATPTPTRTTPPEETTPPVDAPPAPPAAGGGGGGSSSGGGGSANGADEPIAAPPAPPVAVPIDDPAGTSTGPAGAPEDDAEVTA